MKLPGGNQNLGVQSLGRENLDDGTGAAKARLAGVVVDEVSRYQARKTKHQISMQNANLVIAESDFSSKNDALTYYEYKDLSPEMQGRFSGTEPVPAYELRSELYEAKMRKDIETGAAEITDTRASEVWTATQLANLSRQVSARNLERDKEQTTFQNSQGMAKVTELASGGKHDAAIVVLKGLIYRVKR